jgi:hypothetical protein
MTNESKPHSLLDVFATSDALAYRTTFDRNDSFIYNALVHGPEKHLKELLDKEHERFARALKQAIIPHEDTPVPLYYNAEFEGKIEEQDWNEIAESVYQDVLSIHALTEGKKTPPVHVELHLPVEIEGSHSALLEVLIKPYLSRALDILRDCPEMVKTLLISFSVSSEDGDMDAISDLVQNKDLKVFLDSMKKDLNIQHRTLVETEQIKRYINSKRSKSITTAEYTISVRLKE